MGAKRPKAARLQLASGVDLGRVYVFQATPDGNGILTILSLNAPELVSKDILRNVTNVELSTPLFWQNWGDHSGYQYDYLERGSFYRQWWLANERTIIFFVYKSNTESKDIEIDEINKIVDSITVNKH